MHSCAKTIARAIWPTRRRTIANFSSSINCLGLLSIPKLGHNSATSRYIKKGYKINIDAQVLGQFGE
jgi:hypothetical protein